MTKRSPPERSLACVRSSVLTKYYEYATAGTVPREAYVGASFEEAVNLLWITKPNYGLRYVGRELPWFAEEAAEFPVPPSIDKYWKTAQFGRAQKLVLSGQNLPGDTEQVIIEAVRSVDGLETLFELRALKRVSIDDSALEPVRLSSRIKLEHLALSRCTHETELLVLGLFSPTELELSHGVHDGRAIAKCTRVRRLTVVGETHHLISLSSLPLEVLVLEADWSEDLSLLLTQMAGSLRELRLFSRTPVDLATLAALPKLARVHCSLFDGQRAEAVRLAVQESSKAWVFDTPLAPPAPAGKIRVHRGIEIREELRSGRTRYVIEEDLAERLSLNGDNASLEDRIRRHVDSDTEWGSESGTFVAYSSSMAAAKRIISAILDHPARAQKAAGRGGAPKARPSLDSTLSPSVRKPAKRKSAKSPGTAKALRASSRASGPAKAAKRKPAKRP